MAHNDPPPPAVQPTGFSPPERDSADALIVVTWIILLLSNGAALFVTYLVALDWQGVVNASLAGQRQIVQMMNLSTTQFLSVSAGIGTFFLSGLFFKQQEFSGKIESVLNKRGKITRLILFFSIALNIVSISISKSNENNWLVMDPSSPHGQILLQLMGQALAFHGSLLALLLGIRPRNS